VRRVELLLDTIRKSSEIQHADGDTDSVSDTELLQCINDAQDQVSSIIINEYSNFFLTTGNLSLVADQQSYTLPTNMHLGSKIKKVEYKYGSGTNDYSVIPVGTEFDIRTDFTSTYPSMYCRGYNYLKISPLPASALANGLRLTYTKKLKRLDIRRGIVDSASKTGSTLNTITIDLTPSLGKDSGTTYAARDMLNTVDYICLVDSDGTAVLEGVPIDSYNSSTGVITVRAGFTTTVAAATMANTYVVSGVYSTTHSELPDICERYLVLWSVWKMLRRGGNQFESSEARKELAEVTDSIMQSFAAPDDDIYRLRTDEMWEDL
jgi:hypothetical protein